MIAWIDAALKPNRGDFTIQVEENEEREVPGILILLIKTGVRTCFHIATICSGGGRNSSNVRIEDATDICAQAVLYRSRLSDPNLFFAVYDESTQIVYFCLLIPAENEYEAKAHYSMHDQGEEAAMALQIYVDSNAAVLE